MILFDWTVPSSLSYDSSYALSLSQNGPGSDVSPSLSVVGPTTPQNTSSTTTQPLSTLKNATMAMNGIILTITPGCTGTGVAAAASTYWDTRCGCMKTAVGPASPTGGAFNYTTPRMTGGTAVFGPTLSPCLPASKAEPLDSIFCLAN